MTALTSPLAVIVVAAVAFIAIVVAAIAIVQARAARRALEAYEAVQRDLRPADRPSDPASRPGQPLPDLLRPIAPASPPPIEPSNVPVLVVEDEPGVRELIKRVLVRGGHDVVTVPGPHEALAALERRPEIALMIADVVMPDMDGYGLAAEARTLSPDLRIVFMSAFARDGSRHPAGDSFLPKPFTADSLTSVVNAALGRSAA